MTRYSDNTLKWILIALSHLHNSYSRSDYEPTSLYRYPVIMCATNTYFIVFVVWPDRELNPLSSACDWLLLLWEHCKQYIFIMKISLHIRWCSCRLAETRRVSHMEQELLTLPEHLLSTPVCSGVQVVRSLVSCVVCFIDRCLTFCPFSFFSFGHCFVCPSAI